MNEDDFLFDIYPLADEMDRMILMHRDAHFGGKFSFMIEYYSQEGKGALPDISLERIVQLSRTEELEGCNLSALLLSGSDAECVARAKQAYKQLRDLYEAKEESTSMKLLADLILSEEEVPEGEIDAIVSQGSSMLPLLIDLLTSDEFLDPLFPGYGYAPELAATCLGKLKNEAAIIPLFEVLGKKGFFIEESILEALRNIGQPAKNFLIRTLSLRPLTRDNEKAAMALTYFSEDDEIATIALQQLQDPYVIKFPQLAAYLILMCEGLKNSSQKELFKSLSQNSNFSYELVYEMQMIIGSWK